MGLFSRKKHEEPRVEQLKNRPIAPPVEVVARRAVNMSDDGTVNINVSSVIEAKAAIKQLRIMKKELNVEKKLVNANLTAMRANRRAQIAQHGSKMRGGGNLGKTVRSFQTLGRDAERRNYSNALAPHEHAKRVLDLKLANCDLAIAKLEQYVLDQGTST